MQSRFLLPLLAAGLLMLTSGATHADEWVVDSAVATRLSYNDNLNMQASNGIGDAYLSLAPSVKFSSRTESRDLNLGLGASINRYQDETQNNSVDYRFDGGSKWNGELDQWVLAAGSVRDSTLNSELVNTAQVLERRQRTQNSLTGSWSRAIDMATRASLSLSGTQVRYETGAANLVDFDDNSVSLAMNHALSERWALTGSYTYRDFQTVDNPVDTRTKATSYMLGSIWQASERLSYGISFGRQETETEQTVKYTPCQIAFLGVCLMYATDTAFLVIPSESKGSTYSGNLNYSFESSALSVSLARGLTGSGTGALLRTDSLAMSYGLRFYEDLHASVGGNLTRSRNPANDTGETRFSSFSSSLNWQIDGDLQFTTTVTHSTQRAPGQEKAAEGNLVMFALNWQLSPMSRSK